MLIKSDVEYGRIKNLSPNIQKFLKGIDNGTAPLNYSLVDKLSDGSAFRIVQGLRSMAEQFQDFKKGRRNVSMAFSGSAYALGSGASIENADKVVTYAFSGQSYHNYGLAVDLVVRTVGYSVPKGYKSLKDFYKAIGLDKWAKSCGLTWGGDWSDFSDVVHFEDRSFSIPKDFTSSFVSATGQTYRFNPLWTEKNANFDFIKSYNHKTTKKSVSQLFWLGGLGAVIFYFLNKKYRWF